MSLFVYCIFCFTSCALIASANVGHGCPRSTRFAPTIGKKLTQKECQQHSNLGPKLFRRTLDLCRYAKDLDESKINFSSLVRQFGGNDAQEYMDVIYKHFKKSCFDAGIVNDSTWDANHILVICAIYCWTCDRIYPVRTIQRLLRRWYTHS